MAHIFWRDDGEPEPVPGWWESPGAFWGLLFGGLYLVFHESVFDLVATLF